MNQQILVIDDSEKIHKLVKAILAQEPVEVHCATDPNYGLVLAGSIRPDLILLDVDMPGTDGFEACKQLKTDPATADCPVIFLTSISEVKEKVRGFGLGAMDYITKPFNAAELVARVRRSLRTTQVIRSLESQSLIDPLTGLGNRAMFVRRIASEICLRSRSDHPLSVIVMNLDEFSKINETLGRSVGDQVLEMTGKVLTQLCRLEDVPCRVGGDAFGIIAPHTSGADALILAGRIRKLLAEKIVEPRGESLPMLARQSFGVTASFGVAEATARYDRSMIQRADEALDQARQTGNHVVMAPPASNAMAEAA